MSTLSGQCLCGAVAFDVRGDIQRVSACYCGQCRAQNGGGAFHGAEFNGELSLTKSDALRWYDSSTKARRGFCLNCGSSLFWQSNANPSFFDISLGAFDDDTLFELDAHIFVDDKAPYQVVPDNAPQFSASTSPLQQDPS